LCSRFDNKSYASFNIFRFRLENAYSRPQNGGFSGKSGGNENFFCSFSPLGMQYPGLMPYESNSAKIGCVVLAPGVSKVSGRKKENKKPRERRE